MKNVMVSPHEMNSDKEYVIFLYLFNLFCKDPFNFSVYIHV